MKVCDKDCRAQAILIDDGCYVILVLSSQAMTLETLDHACLLLLDTLSVSQENSIGLS